MLTISCLPILDPDHVEGFRVVEQISLDFRTWRAHPEKQICLLLPEQLRLYLQLNVRMTGQTSPRMSSGTALIK